MYQGVSMNPMESPGSYGVSCCFTAPRAATCGNLGFAKSGNSHPDGDFVSSERRLVPFSNDDVNDSGNNENHDESNK